MLPLTDFKPIHGDLLVPYPFDELSRCVPTIQRFDVPAPLFHLLQVGMLRFLQFEFSYALLHQSDVLGIVGKDDSLVGARHGRLIRQRGSTMLNLG